MNIIEDTDFLTSMGNAFSEVLLPLYPEFCGQD